MTDRGQIVPSTDDLTHLAPQHPGLAEATAIAPERKASPLPSSTSEVSSAEALVPSVNVSIDGERPQSPPTLIPQTDTLSTRPTRGGIAYPFRLKVQDAEGREVNASTITLQSLSVATPGLNEFEEKDKGIGAVDGVQDGQAEKEKDKEERPPIERFETAMNGELKTVEDRSDAETEDFKSPRPEIERFETAQEDLNTLANGNGKA